MTGRHGGAVRGRLHRRLGNGDLTAVPEVRHALRDLLGKWPERAEDGTADAADVAELLASELVTNALIHTDHGAVVTATVEDSRLHVEVQDFMAGLPVPDIPTAELGTGGRGLVLVERLADAWGVRTAQGVGKVIWFELHAQAA
ncbi:ATP-binding protein [Streptomyces sp. Tu 2975]|uniref:ATP-binding protein n=1 Tax=Streptomyces sp. Tu 2975 TaxID=2676871 RepID=UPI00135C5F5B|nr:ATP-binding protein [Streptomyces sp. Tu 2975]QIP83955.1 ATP-binding protein [Streptomyces sp. Tu 2975]